MPIRVKSRYLTVLEKIKIGKHKEKFPEITNTNLAVLFNCTYDQARRAVIQYNKGMLNRGQKRVKSKKTEEIKKDKTPDEIFSSQYHTSLAALESDIQIQAIDRITCLEKLARVRKIDQSIKLSNHIKRADADIIAALIRRYVPEATDEMVISIYREEFAKLQVRDE